ncbi:MAG: DUF3180 domain-containing protein [Actinomycetota bacterium]
MRPTKILSLVATALAVAGGSFLLTGFLVTRGYPVALSPFNFSLTLIAIAAVIALLGIPLWRYRTALKRPNVSSRPKRVDPFYAVQVLLLSKATSISGSIFVGWHLGLLLYQLFSPIVVLDALGRNLFAFIAALLMVVSGFVTELVCRLPDSGDESEAATA